VRPTRSTARRARKDVDRTTARFAPDDPPVTRLAAMISDLTAVRVALDTAGIDVLLVRNGRDVPVLAVDRTRRGDVEAAFETAFADTPFFARVDRRGDHDGKGSERLLALGRLPGDENDETFLLYRRRQRSARPGWKVADAAVRLELWAFGETDVVAPRANALTRRTIARVDTVATTVERHGMSWPTIAGMFDDHVDDVDFPIDMVFSWVDGTRPEHMAERARYQGGAPINQGDLSPARYRQVDELRFALRSVRAFAPWVRRIFIATDSPAPAWLDTDHPDVRIVRSEEFFADRAALPTFNSHAIEAQLHRIPGLSEHFLYSNDDMFFGRPVSPSLFFSPGGVTKFVEASLRIGVGGSSGTRSGHDNAMRVNRELLKDRFGRTITRHLEHCAVPLRVSVLEELASTFPEEFRRTAASRFRSPTDISVTNSLAPYFGLLSGRAVQQADARALYIETTLASTAAALARLGRSRRFDMFCLNDGSEPQIDESTRVELVTSFLERYFPIAGPWERATLGAAAS
jgi:UDP-glucose 4-epimerase